MLENMVKSETLVDADSVRAALVLSQSFRRKDLMERLVAAARCHKREALRGLAAAALFDLGQEDLASRFADELVHSKQLTTVGWAALIRAGGAGKLQRLVTESRFRRVQRGWAE
jgi:hypothetical protein